MASVNPYRAPAAAVADTAEQFQPVSIFSASGRIGRARYIAYTLGLSILLMLLAGGAALVLGNTLGGILALVIYLGLIVWQVMLTIQRAHDFNVTGWLCLLVFVPLGVFVFWLVPGTDGENRFGARTPPNSTLVLIGAWMVPVLFIGGIVAAVALPAYQDYVKRAHAMQKK